MAKQGETGKNMGKRGENTGKHKKKQGKAEEKREKNLEKRLLTFFLLYVGLRTVVTRMDSPKSDCHLHSKYMIGIL